MKQVCTIAGNTFLEAARQPVYTLLIAVGVLSIVTLPALALFNFGEVEKFVRDVGLAAILVMSGAVAVFAASGCVYDEIQRKTTLTVLSKPVSREAFVIGKYLGVLLAVLASMLIFSTAFHFIIILTAETAESPIASRASLSILLFFLILALGVFAFRLGYLTSLFTAFFATTIATAITLYRVSEGYNLIDFQTYMLSAYALTAMQLSVIVAVAVAASVRLPLVLSACASFIVFALGHLWNHLFRNVTTDAGTVSSLYRIPYSLIPNLENFNLADHFAIGGSIPLAYLSNSFGYTILVSAAILLIAISLFTNREVM